MKTIFLQRAGVKTEAQFLKKYQTEDAFFADHPDLEDYKVGIKGPGTQLYKDFLENLKKGMAYEANNNYRAVNDSIKDKKGIPIASKNALGKYQFVPESHWTKIQKFAKDNGLEVPEKYTDFLNNETLQEQYFEFYAQKELFPFAQKNKGKVPGLSLDDLGYMYHHDGPAGAAEFVKTGKYKEATDVNPKGEVYLNGFRSTRKVNGGTPVEGFTNAEVKANYEKFKNEIATIEKNPNHLSTELIGKMKMDVQERYTKDGFIPYFNEVISQENKANAIDLDNKQKVLTGIKTMLENPDYLKQSDVTQANESSNKRLSMVVPLSEYEQLSKMKEFEKYKQYFSKNPSYAKPGQEKMILSFPLSNDKNNILNELQNDIRAIPGNEDFSIYNKDNKIKSDENWNWDYNTSEKGENFRIKNGMFENTHFELPSYDLSRINEIKPVTIPRLEEVVPDVPPEVAPVKKEDATATTTTPQATGPSDMDKWIDYSKQKDAAAEKAKNDNLLKDYFGDDLPEPTPENPNAKKKDNFPYMEVLSQIGGIVTGLGMADKKINYRDEQVNDDFRNYTAELSKLSQIGLRPEEEAYAKKMLTESYQGSIDHIAQASNGNRNQVLGNLGRVDSQYNKGLMDIAIADAQVKNEALAKYGEAMKYINEFDARRDITNNERKYDNIIRTKEAGANLAGNAMAAFIDSIHNYQDNKPGSWNDMYKSHMSRRLFNVDFTLKDDKSGTIPYTASWNAKQQETILAHSHEHNAYKEMFSQLSPDKQKTVNDVFRQSGGDIMTTYKLIDYAKQNNFSGDIDMTKYDSAKATGDFSNMLKASTTPSTTTPVGPQTQSDKSVNQQSPVSENTVPFQNDMPEGKITSQVADLFEKSKSGDINPDDTNSIFKQLNKSLEKLF